MRRIMRSEGLVPDLVLVSPARRTMETLSALQPWDKPPVIDEKQELYLATAPGMLQLIRNVSDRVGSVLLIGHNPGLQDLAVLLVGAHKGRGSETRTEFGQGVPDLLPGRIRTDRSVVRGRRRLRKVDPLR